MTGIVLRLTLRQLLGRRRILISAALALVPVALALAYRLGGAEGDPQDWAANTLLAGLVATTILPLVALVHGTASIGGELDDGTALQLLATPVPRSRIVLAKLIAASAVTAGTIVVPALVAAAIALQGEASGGLLVGFGVALTVGAAVYCALFLLLRIVTGKALVIGLAYVLVWEGVVNGLFAGTRLLSVRHGILGLADAAVDLPVFDPPLGAATAVALLAIVGAGSAAYAVRRLQRWEIGEVV